MKEAIKKLRHNHGVMMIICCGAPLIVLAISVYFFGLSNSYLYWSIILLCPLMHFWMMKNMHKEHPGEMNRDTQSPVEEKNVRKQEGDS